MHTLRNQAPPLWWRLARLCILLAVCFGITVYARSLSALIDRHRAEDSESDPLPVKAIRDVQKPPDRVQRPAKAEPTNNRLRGSQAVPLPTTDEVSGDSSEHSHLPPHAQPRSPPKREERVAEADAPTQALIIQEEPGPGTDEKDVCPICGSTQSSPFVREKQFQLAKCSHCGFLYLNPMPFHNLDPNTRTYREHWEEPKVTAMKRKVLDFYPQSELAKVRMWLDVGCGNGELLRAVGLVAPHINATGLETTKYKMNTARAKGLIVREQPLESIAERYEVVSTMNVLSHVPRPVSFYRAVGNLVAPGGCIFTSTGNAADVTLADAPGRFDLGDHLVFAGKRHIYTIFHRIGFRVAIYREYKHFWDNYAPLKPGPFRAIYVKACRPKAD